MVYCEITNSARRIITDEDLYLDDELCEKYNLQLSMDDFIRINYDIDINYSTSIIMHYLFYHMPKSIKRMVKGDANENNLMKIIFYLREGLERAYEVVSGKYHTAAYQKFYKMFDEYYDGKDKLDAIRKIKEKNIAEFESMDMSFKYINANDIENKWDTYKFRAKKLISDENIQEKASSDLPSSRVNSARDRINAYIQRRFIEGCPMLARKYNRR